VRLLTHRDSLSIAVPITSTPQRTPALIVLPLLVLVPTLAFIAVRRFDGLYGQDAFAYYDYSLGPLRQALIDRAPLPAFFCPPGYPLLVALTSFLVGNAAGQVVSLAMGALVPLLTALLARALFPTERWLPLLAGVLVAACGQLWQSSMVIMADTTGLALATLAAFAVARYARGRHLAWLLLASAAICGALLSRWIYGLVALPLALYVLAARPKVGDALAALLVGLLLLAPVLAQPLLGLVQDPSAPAAFAGNFQVYSWSPANAFQREFNTPDGTLSYERPNGLYYALAPGNLALFGPLLAPLLLLGLLVGLRTWRGQAMLLVLGWAAIVYAFHAGAPWQNFRFALAYVPPLAILIAAALCWLAHWLETRIVVAWLLLGLVVMSFGAVRLVNGFVNRQQDERLLVSWVESQVPPDAQLLAFGPTLTFTHFSALPTRDLFDLPDAELRSTSPTYLLVDVSNLEAQWQRQRPAQVYEALRDGPGLRLLGSFGNFSLFHVQST
jgi:4-amino-4-deoxy-L-arabinose transferase-like glycosyltransferase